VSAATETIAVDRRTPMRHRLRRRSDLAVIRGAQAGREADLEELFRRHWRRAYRVAYLIVHDHAAAEDIAQEAFVAAIRSLDRFDRRRPFGPWIGRIVTNRAIDWTRARTARREVDHEPQDVPGPGTSVELDYTDELIVALASLSPEHRAVVVTPGCAHRSGRPPAGLVT
jgi:RNA polymerase sigma-70 factor (ECF subfamily)